MVQAWSAGYFVLESDPILADKAFIVFLCDNIFQFQAK